MSKLLFSCLLLGVIVFPLNCLAGSVYSEGIIDNDLRYEGFEINESGFVTGFIINSSSAVRRAVKLDMWTTNPQETRIYWRHVLNIGDMAPGAKFAVKEPYKPVGDTPGKTKFMFRIPQNANFRNQ